MRLTARLSGFGGHQPEDSGPQRMPGRTGQQRGRTGAAEPEPEGKRSARAHVFLGEGSFPGASGVKKPDKIWNVPPIMMSF